MVLPDTLSLFKPQPGPEIALDTTIHHACLSPVRKETFNLTFEIDVEMCSLTSCQAGLMTSRKSHVHYVLTGNTVNHSLLKIDSCSMEKPSSYLQQKGRRSFIHCTSHTKASPKHSSLPVDVSSGPLSLRPLKELYVDFSFCCSNCRS